MKRKKKTIKFLQKLPILFLFEVLLTGISTQSGVEQNGGKMKKKKRFLTFIDRQGSQHRMACNKMGKN